MREILFRGKRIDNGEWVIGFLSKTRGLDNKLHICIDYEEKGVMCSSIVIPETIGQYTGLTDKNGKKIFEGDILRYYDDEIQIVEWNREFSNLMLHTYCKYEIKKGRKVVIENSDGWNWLHDYPLNEMSIIGNIHDNPELLKEAEQE